MWELSSKEKLAYLVHYVLMKNYRMNKIELVLKRVKSIGPKFTLPIWQVGNFSQLFRWVEPSINKLIFKAGIVLPVNTKLMLN